MIGAHPVAPFTHLEGQQTRSTETVVHPERILTADDGTPVADFGKVIPARPGVRFDAGRRRSGGHDPRPATAWPRTAGRPPPRVDTQGTNMTFPYTQAPGRRTTRPSATWAFRYLEIPGAGEAITADDVTATVVHTAYPEDGEATFDELRRDPGRGVGPDARARSQYSVQETFVDTPTREQGQFLHDTVNISYGADGDRSSERVATRQAIREFMLSQERYWTYRQRRRTLQRGLPER